MEYAVFGAGGTGGCIGSYLAKAGDDVTLIARGKHLDAIRRNGISVRSERIGNFRIPVKACSAEEYSGHPDVIFVCVKYNSLPDAADFIRRTADADTLTVPILNIFGTGEVLQEECPDRTVLDGCIYIMSMVGEPGVILQPAPIFRVFLGFRGGQEQSLRPKALQTVRGLAHAKIDAFFTDEILKEELKKFSFVSPMGAVCLYLNAHGGDFKTPGEARTLFNALIGEVETLGRAMGITYDEDLAEVNRKIMEGLSDDATTSMQRDVAAGKPSEIDGLIHRVVRLAGTYGISLPNYEKISAWAKEKGIR